MKHFESENEVKDYLDKHNVPYYVIKFEEYDNFLSVLLDKSYGSIEILRLFYGGYYCGRYTWIDCDEKSRWMIFHLDELKKYEDDEFRDEKI